MIRMYSKALKIDICLIIILAFFIEKKWIMCNRLPSVRLSVRQSICPSGSIVPSTPLLLMLGLPNLYMRDNHMHTDVGSLFEIFLHIPVLKKLRFS